VVLPSSSSSAALTTGVAARCVATGDWPRRRFFRFFFGDVSASLAGTCGSLTGGGAMEPRGKDGLRWLMWDSFFLFKLKEEEES
jgi:hypothetical protein